LAGNDNLTQLRLRKENIEQRWEEFNMIQNGLETLADSAEQRQYRDDFENAYFSILAEAEDKLSAQKYANNQPSTEIENVSISSQSTVSAPSINETTRNTYIYGELRKMVYISRLVQFNSSFELKHSRGAKIRVLADVFVGRSVK